MKVGVLALQGNFREHARMLKRCGAETALIRKPAEMNDVSALVIPGGESTAIWRLMHLEGLHATIIARALSGEPDMLLADEPTGNLDSKKGAEIMDMMNALNKEGVTVVMVTHDPILAKKAKRIVRIKDGIVEKEE